MAADQIPAAPVAAAPGAYASVRLADLPEVPTSQARRLGGERIIDDAWLPPGHPGRRRTPAGTAASLPDQHPRADPVALVVCHSRFT